MRNLRNLTAVVLLAMSLGGCATWQKFETTLSNAAGVIGSTRVNSKSDFIAINTFNAAERLVTAYLRLPLCNGSTPVCRKAGAVATLSQPFEAGISARNDLRAFMRAHPGTLADAGLYTSLVSATSALQRVMSIYGIGG